MIPSDLGKRPTDFWDLASVQQVADQHKFNLFGIVTEIKPPAQLRYGECAW
jgi:hypothetical protein